MKHLRILYLCLLVLCQSRVGAQQYNFRNYSVKEGVAQSQVYSLLQDSRGYLWLGTRGGGLSCFDGISFKNLTRKDGLSNNYVFCIREAPDHRLWIGTNNGLSHYNGVTFTNYTLTDTAQLQVLDIAFDKQQRLWLATNYGVLLFDKGRFTNISTLMKDRITLINKICIDPSGNIWYGNVFGLAKITVKNGSYTQELFNKNNKFENVSVNALSWHPDGTLWIGTYRKGLFTCKNGNFRRPVNDKELEVQSIFDIYFDQDGNAWLATLDKGVCQYTAGSNTLNWLGENEGLSNNHVRSITQDRSGTYWFGTSGGGACNYFGRQFTVYDKNSGLGGNFIYSIFRDSRQRLFIGTSDKGFSMLDSGRFTRFNADNGFANVKVKAIHEDSMHNIYLGTDGDGVFVFDGIAFKRLETFANKYIRAITRDKQYNLYIATAGSGIYKFYPAIGTAINISTRQGLLGNRINCLHYDKSGRLWYGTENNGIGVIVNDRVSDTRFTTKNGLPSDAIRCFTEDKKGYLWAGTAGNGLVSFPLYQGDYPLRCYDHQNGLSSSNIYLLVTDAKNYLYAGSETGIDRIITDDKRYIEGVRHYSKGEGFTGIETCQNAVYSDSNDVIWFGTINGLTKYTAAAQYTNKHEAITRITDVRLFYEPISKTAYKAYAGDWNTIKRITLPYNQNHLSFDFMAINLSNPDAVQYQWMLQGFDEDWSPVSKQRTVTYSNLPHGKYVFLVRACNEDGIWNKQPQAFYFSITPPFWLRWWVIAGAALLLITLLWLLFRLRIRSIRRKSQQQQQKIQMEKELLELEQKALRLQMNPHFIFNALNSIQSQIGTDNEQAARYYLAKFSRLMRQILDNSRNTQIPLQEEISTLENYLLIEKFCNGDRFDYEIHVDAHIGTDEISIPPMLLQPFIENAIKHGLKHTDNTRGLISISIKEHDNILECAVTDNGIGREKSAELNKQSKETWHKSTALLVTQERLDLLKTDPSLHMLEILDLYDNGEASGTKVIIRIPLQ